jgi:hypothetical protein
MAAGSDTDEGSGEVDVAARGLRIARYLGAVVAAVLALFALLPHALEPPTVGGVRIDQTQPAPTPPGQDGDEQDAAPAAAPTGVARFVTDANVRAVQLSVPVLFASVAGGIVAGALAGRWPTSAKGAGFEIGLSPDEAKSFKALETRIGNLERRAKAGEQASGVLLEQLELLRAEMDDMQAQPVQPVKPADGR